MTMATPRIGNVTLESLEAPLKDALTVYEGMSGLDFDVDQALHLELTPDKPNSARSATLVTAGDEVIGKLFVIAFKHQDGTGDESSYYLDDLIRPEPYPADARIVPRVKRNPAKPATERTAHEVAMSLASVDKGGRIDPVLYGGVLDILGLDLRVIQKIGEVGHDPATPPHKLKPLATYTVGDTTAKGTALRTRFGDPHSIFNADTNRINVVGFLGISDDIVEQHGSNILKGLNPQWPRGMVLPDPPRRR